MANLKVPSIHWRGMLFEQSFASPRTATLRTEYRLPSLFVSIEVRATKAGQPHDYEASIQIGKARSMGRANDPVDALEEARQAILGLASLMTGAFGAVEIPVNSR